MSASTITSARPSGGAAVRATRIAVAWLALLSVDVLMKTRGFRALHRLVDRWPVRGATSGAAAASAADVPRTRHSDAARAIAEAVDTAARWYPKRAWCLQRSVVAVLFLRSRGIAAELVIGVRRMPFYAHAWVELDGVVINDAAEVQKTFSVMERCRP